MSDVRRKASPGMSCALLYGLLLTLRLGCGA